MLKFFDMAQGVCHIVLEAPLVKDDVETLRALLKKEYISWSIEFGRVYNVGVDVIEILYEEISQNKKNISITTHKNKLNRYLNDLGFTSRFHSLIKEDVLSVNEIQIILIGGSADSSSKVIQIVKDCAFNDLTLIIVQHVEPNRVGNFDEVLSRYTNNKVSYAKDGQIIEKSHIYLAPPNRHLKVNDGAFVLSNEGKYNYSKPSISISYDSFSSFYKEKLLIVQECGYANDGVDKLQLLKENKSKIVIQEISECEAKPMVQNAIMLGVHDFVLSINDIIDLINIIDFNISKEAWIEYLLEKIYEAHSYDFRLYHKDMVSRRIGIFMLKHDIKHIKDAVVTILFNSSAFKGFFLELSINVTELFRKPESFKNSVKLLNKYHKNSHALKVWSAGCSSGEEVYSMTILLDSLGLLEKSIIYATDFNPVVLQEAQNGVYSLAEYEVAKVNFKKVGLETDLNNYVKVNNNYITISEKLKEKTLFFQHNLIEDSSFNEFDIIICKNVIIYFNDNLQKRVFQLFYDSLKFGGHLILGESEMIIPMFSNKFERCNDNCKIFRKIA